MRGWHGSLCVAVVACYQPTVATDIPCAHNGDCPDGQFCDADLPQPLCVTALPDAAPVDAAVDAAADARDATGAADASPDAAVDGGGAPAIALVQATSSKPQGMAPTLALPAPVAAGDAIILCLNFEPGGNNTQLAGITDSLGNIYQVVVGPIAANNELHFVAVAADSPAGADTVTLALSAPLQHGGNDWFLLEYAGLAANEPFDTSANASGDGTAMDSGPAQTSFPNELLIGYAEAAGASSGDGFTTEVSQSGNLVEDQIVGATGSYDATATSTGGGWEMILATFAGQSGM